MVKRVKVISKTGNLARQLPHSNCWGGLHFTFDRAARQYDWLVVYDDIPAVAGGKVSHEQLSCPREHTILVTHEPASVKIHGSDFINQFNYVLTCHEDWAMRHKNKIAMQPLSPWWYGRHIKNNNAYTYDGFQQTPPLAKTKELSTICSAKQQKHTLHNARYKFTKQLSPLLPQMEWFGHGVRRIDDKVEAMEAYRYHIAVENHLCPHYWTEKLADCFLAYCLPFYYGCPNAADYFPQDSFIVIDINNVEQTAKIIREAIDSDAYSKSLPAIIEARRRLLEENNFFAVVSDFINRQTTTSTPAGETIYSRRTLISKSPAAAVRYLIEKTRNQLYFRKIYKIKGNIK